jgi:TPP-dependent pyruvate/acetoin dehydrogenase alpha subunit
MRLLSFGTVALTVASFHGFLNLASTWNCRVSFVCEKMAGLFPTPSNHQNVTDISDRASGYGIPVFSFDGKDVVAVLKRLSQPLTVPRNR